MRRFLLRLIGLAAVLAAGGVVWVVATLPPAAARPALPRGGAEDLVAGAYHIHSIRSDGSGTVDAIAAAAARAGLRFVILTDHGDATRPPDPPAYRHGVLCIDAVEVSSADGHVVALNLPSAAPYPLAGETRDVVDDIHRLGGWAIAAHPDSPRVGLRWRASGVAVDGIEWFSADSEWRAQPIGTLVATAARAFFRPPEAIATLFRSAGQSLRRWDAALARQPTFTIAAVDAHARLGEDTESGAASRTFALSYPSYETMFRTVVQTVRPVRPLTGDAAADAAGVLAAIGAGQSYSVMRAFVDAPLAFEFSARSAEGRVLFGGSLAGPGPVTLQAGVPAGVGARLALLKDGRQVAAGSDAVDFQTTEAGTYRVEARLAGRAVPWIVSNAIRVVGGAVPGAAVQPPPSAPGPPPAAASAGVAIPLDSWVIESSPTSTGAKSLENGALRLRYRLGPGSAAGQYVALASAASGDLAIERIEFVAASARPMRVSVQIRLPGGVNGRRWRRSIYVDEVPRQVSVALADFDPVERQSSLHPVAARVQSVLLVIDTLNTLPGTEGELVIRDVRVVPGKPPNF